MSQEANEERESIIKVLPELYHRAKAVGLEKTSRALADAIRLGQWEISRVFDTDGLPYNRRANDYSEKVIVLIDHDELLTL